MTKEKEVKKEKPKTRNTVAMAIIKNKTGKVLIVQRVHPEKGSDDSVLTWAFPGGRIEEGETPEDAAVREVEHEAGYIVIPIKLISERKHPQFDTYLYYVSCELDLTKAPKPSFEVHEIETTRWVDPQILKKFFTTDIDPGVMKFLGL